jgi:ribonucleoside-diphosphate reductase alpha chain
MDRVRLQATAQKHIDHSISSTINLPKDATPEIIDEIYRTAWHSGCKGITVYREGSRAGVILNNEVDKNESCDTIKRPRKLPCDVHHITVKGQQYFVLVGLMDDTPYEVFAGKNGHLSKTIKHGTIIRKRKDFYKAEFEEADEELAPITACCNELEEIITRLTSLALRSGADMHVVVKQLEKVGERQEVNSFARSVARALKKYIPDGTEEGEICPECSSNSVVRQEGCVLCKACGFSRCL